MIVAPPCGWVAAIDRGGPRLLAKCLILMARPERDGGCKLSAVCTLRFAVVG